MTPTPVSEDYDGQDFSTLDTVESAPVGGDLLSPMQFLPLPTTRSQPEHLDISHGGSGQGGGSGEGGSGDGRSSGGELSPTVIPDPSWLETTSSSLLTTEVVLPEIFTPVPGLPAGGGGVEPQRPAVVFKEDVTPEVPLAPDVNQSLVIPGDGESTAKPPFHVIIVNVHSQNHSGE